jgi:signal transduction histidine kinase
MAATVAHNVKNPLSSMKTLLQLLGEAPNLAEDQSSDIDKVVAEIDRLSRTVSSLLEFSRLEKSQRPSPREVDVGRLVDSVAGVFEGDFKSKNLRLKTLFEPVRLRVESDDILLREILSNLLSNAVEASKPGGEIVISVGADRDHLRLAVEDQGEGVPERLRRSIFLPFFSTKSRGTGLGLAIVQKRVEQLGGEIRLESSRGSRGARFVVRLPVQTPLESG